jgi:ankyrin repeat protein
MSSISKPTLFQAVKKNDIAKVASLIERGANVNGNPWPLMYAAKCGLIEIMTLLLDSGADVNAVDNYHYSVCQFAIIGEQPAALRLLIARGAIADAALFSNARFTDGDQIYLALLESMAQPDGLPHDDLLRAEQSCF